MLPMGFDSFGLPAENAAIDRGVHPADWTNANIDRMRAQFRPMGASWDWSREVIASDPSFYRWTQWLFLQFFKAGLAYKAMAAVDWCPKDQVVLAREQVLGAGSPLLAVRHAGHQARPGAVVLPDHEVRRRAARLHGLDWPEPILLMQTNWIGRSEGAEIDFRRRGPTDVEPIRVFTTRPDTMFGATFMVLAPGAPDGAPLTTDERRAEVEAYVADARRETEIDRLGAEREKTGVFTGAYAVNPLTDEPVPIWVADYVLPGYGTGAIMGVPAHDERDFDFARRYDLPIAGGGRPPGGRRRRRAFTAHTEDEVLVNSGEFTGMSAAEAIPAITEAPRRAGLGEAADHLQDPRLAGEPAALLGRAHPDRVLRRPRAAAGPRVGAARPAAAGRRLRPDRGVAAPVARRIPGRHLPGRRRARAARDRHDGHLRRFELVFPPLRSPHNDEAAWDPEAMQPGCRWTCTPAGPSTPSCTCCTAASSSRRCGTWATWRSTSRSSPCATRARSWAPITSA